MAWAQGKLAPLAAAQVFVQPNAAAGKAAVAALAARGVLVDCRCSASGQACVRVGFGPGHCAADVDALLSALAE